MLNIKIVSFKINQICFDNCKKDIKAKEKYNNNNTNNKNIIEVTEHH